MTSVSSSRTESQIIPASWRRAARIFWGVVFILIIGLFVVAVVDSIRLLAERETFADYAWVAELGLRPALLAGYFLLLDIFSALVFAGVSFVLIWRRADNRMALLTSVAMIAMGVAVVNTSFYLLNETRPALQSLLTGLRTIGLVSFVLFIYTVPQGRFENAKVATAAFLACLWFANAGLFPEQLIGWLGMPIFSAISAILYMPVPLLLRRDLRRPQDLPHAEQQQMKWISAGLFAAFAGYMIVTATQLLSFYLSSYGVAWLLATFLTRLLFTIAITTLPLSIAFAVMRYRLWEVDFVINRSLIYGILTVGLVIVTIIDLLILQWFFQLVTGRDQAMLALIIAALVSGAAFQPTRRWLQRFVDRHLYGIQIAYKEAKKPALPEPPSLPESQQTLGSYRVQELIGQGGMARVYRGEHITLRKPVAIKLMRSDQASVADFRTRFEREAQAVAALSHPNIIEVFDFGAVDDTYYMVMEYVTGQALSHYLQERKRLPLPESLAYLQGLAGALDYAHSQNIIHRDIKPSNVMLQPATNPNGDSNGHYKPILTDFGIAKIRSGGTAITQTGMVGTLDYIAPEQIRDAKDVDGRADVYALGVMAYQMLTGALPFRGGNPAAIVIAHLQQPAPDPRELAPELPASVGKGLMKAMAKSPEERFLSAGAFVQAISV